MSSAAVRNFSSPSSSGSGARGVGAGRGGGGGGAGVNLGALGGFAATRGDTCVIAAGAGAPVGVTGLYAR